MATYNELFDLRHDADLTNRAAVAIVVVAETIRTEGAVANHSERLTWALAAMDDPHGEAEKFLWNILAQNKSATVGQITGASDATLQTAIDTAVDFFAGVAV